MPLYLPKEYPDSKSQYASFIGPEKSSRILDFFTFSWNGKTQKILESLKREESRDFTLALLLANPRWLKTNLGFGIELYKTIRKDKSEKGKALKDLLRTTYKVDRVLVWDSSKRKMTTRRYLKASGADLSASYFRALKNGNERQIRLLRPLVDINSLLLEAFQKNEIRVVESLLDEKEIDINVSNQNGDTPLSLAMAIAKKSKGKDLRVLKLLIKKKGSEIPNGEILNQPLNADGYSPLHMSSEENDVDFAKALLQIPGIDPHILSKRNNPPLNGAILRQRPEIIELLLSHPDIDVNLKGNQGNTALAMAILMEDFSTINRLMRREEIDFAVKNDANSTLLIVATKVLYKSGGKSQESKDLILQLLEKKQIDLFATDASGHSAFYYAARVGREILEILFSCLPDDHRFNREALAEFADDEVPEPPEEVKDRKIDELFTKYSSNYWGIQRMVKQIAKRSPYATALPPTDEGKAKYYDRLEKRLKNIVYYLDRLPEAEREAPLQMLNEGGHACAVRWMQESLLVFAMLSGNDNLLSPSGKIKAFVKNLLLQSYQEMVKDMSTKRAEVHTEQAWLALIGKELHLPGADEDLSDIYAPRMMAKEHALTLFFKGYFTPAKIVESLKKHITDREARPKLTDTFADFWKEKISLEWAQAMTKESFHELVDQYAKALHEKPKEVSAILAYRLKNILPKEELKSSNFDWLRRIHMRKKMKSIAETTRSNVGKRLDSDLDNRRLERTMDEDMIFLKEEIFEETLYALGIFSQQTEQINEIPLSSPSEEAI